MFSVSDGASNIVRYLQFFHSLIEFMNVNDDYIVLFVGLVITKKSDIYWQFFSTA